VAVVGCGGSHFAPDGTSGVTTPAVSSVSPSQARALGLTRKLPAAYRQACGEQLAYAPAGAQVCPPLIPAGRLKVIDATPFSKRKAYRGGYLADVSSASLSELDGKHVETNGGHWHYDVSWTPAVRRLLVRRGIERPANANMASKCRHVRLGGERVEVCHVVPYEKGGGLNGGHVAYVWTQGRVTYVVSLHGYANEPRARVMTLALMAQVLTTSCEGGSALPCGRPEPQERARAQGKENAHAGRHP
jgi:hypothetical protein